MTRLRITEPTPPCTRADYEKVLRKLNPNYGYTSTITRCLHSLIESIHTGEPVPWAHITGTSAVFDLHLTVDALIATDNHLNGREEASIENLLEYIEQVNHAATVLSRHYAASALHSGAFTRTQLLTNGHQPLTERARILYASLRHPNQEPSFLKADGKFGTFGRALHHLVLGQVELVEEPNTSTQED